MRMPQMNEKIRAYGVGMIRGKAYGSAFTSWTGLIRGLSADREKIEIETRTHAIVSFNRRQCVRIRGRAQPFMREDQGPITGG